MRTVISFDEACSLICVWTGLECIAAAAPLVEGMITRGTVRAMPNNMTTIKLGSTKELDFIPILNPGETYPGVLDEYGAPPERGPYRNIDLEDLKAATALIKRGAASFAEAEAPASPSRPRGRGLQAADTGIVKEMNRWFKAGEANSPTDAAWKIIGLRGDGAQGGGTPQSKVDRLVRRHKQFYGE